VEKGIEDQNLHFASLSSQCEVWICAKGDTCSAILASRGHDVLVLQCVTQSETRKVKRVQVGASCASLHARPKLFK
jgi:hypothetical protein